mmetsp:Transcript_86699/g.220855  ORF Transcript_86699/g.220855 Transcript_86699/m.220855 type:complete len:359 (-) Transcript_86699:42-1118(-)
MPRGPGKKENYNFDYSRFNGLDQQQQEQVNPQDAGVPDDIFRQLPGELQEAVRLMQIARQTGDQKAQERANELALKAVERGGPEMKQRFQQELMRQAAQNPEARQGVEAMLNSGSLNASHSPSTDKMMDLSSTIANLHTNMEAGARRAADQLENMQKQQEMLENLRGPEDFARFMAEQGLSQEDLQRALAGDESHMRNCIEKTLGKFEDPTAKKEQAKLDQMLGAVNDIHKTLTGNDTPDTEAPPISAPRPAAPSKPAKQPEEEPAKPEPAIPEHRVQYQKDESGRLLQVELKCELPGIESMDAIEVDVSEKYLRLRTNSPAYVVNVGPFPNLVDAPAARAKFSKKRQELTLTVPAKP